MKAIILLLAVALCCGSVHAQVPRKINYQGYLTTPVGTPVNATVSMALKLYNVLTGGAALYTETQTVTVTNGVFNVRIGSVTPLALPFDVPYYLGITRHPLILAVSALKSLSLRTYMRRRHAFVFPSLVIYDSPMPTIRGIAGPYRLFFFSFDCNEPEHVHVQRERKVCKFWMEPLVLASNHGFSPIELNAIRRILKDNRARIVEAWHEHCGGN